MVMVSHQLLRCPDPDTPVAPIREDYPRPSSTSKQVSGAIVTDALDPMVNTDTCRSVEAYDLAVLDGCDPVVFNGTPDDGCEVHA